MNPGDLATMLQWITPWVIVGFILGVVTTLFFFMWMGHTR